MRALFKIAHAFFYYLIEVRSTYIHTYILYWLVPTGLFRGFLEVYNEKYRSIMPYISLVVFLLIYLVGNCAHIVGGSS